MRCVGVLIGPHKSKFSDCPPHWERKSNVLRFSQICMTEINDLLIWITLWLILLIIESVTRLFILGVFILKRKISCGSRVGDS